MLTFLDSYVPLDWEKSPCHSGGRGRGGVGRIISFDYHVILLSGEFIPAPTQKASIGMYMYSGCDNPHKSYLLLIPSLLHPLISLLFILTSVLLCNLSMPSDMIFPSTPKFTVMVQYVAYR